MAQGQVNNRGAGSHLRPPCPPLPGQPPHPPPHPHPSLHGTVHTTQWMRQSLAALRRLNPSPPPHHIPVPEGPPKAKDKRCPLRQPPCHFVCRVLIHILNLPADEAEGYALCTSAFVAVLATPPPHPPPPPIALRAAVSQLPVYIGSPQTAVRMEEGGQVGMITGAVCVLLHCFCSFKCCPVSQPPPLVPPPPPSWASCCCLRVFLLECATPTAVASQ